MANRFYIQPQQRESLSSQLYKIMEVKQRGDIAKQQALTEKERLAQGQQTIDLTRQRQEAEFGSPGQPETMVEPGTPAIPGLKQRELGVHERQVGVMEKNAAISEKENVDLQNFEPIKAARVVKTLTSIGLPKDHPLAQRITELALDKNVTNADAYNDIKAIYPQYRAELIQTLSDDFLKNDEKNPYYQKSPKGQMQQQLISMLGKDDTGDMVIGSAFSSTLASMKRREATTMTAQATLVKALKPEGPQSDIGKLQEDKKRYLQEGYTADSPLIQALDAEIQNKAKGKQEAEPEIMKLIKAYNTAPEDSPDKKLIMARINKLTETSGLQLRVNPDGTIELLQGPAAGKMSIKTTGAIEEKIIGGKEHLARLQSISEEFRPEYLETGTRLKAAWTGIKAKLGQNVPPENAKLLTEFKKFQRKAIENINLYIKEITGAQMSEKEADRIRLAQADPGEKWYQGDDPITFKAKMDDVMKSTRAAIARYEYYKTKGLSDTEIKGLIKSDQAISLDDLIKRMQ